MSTPEIAEFEAVLDQENPDMFKWLTGQVRCCRWAAWGGMWWGGMGRHLCAAPGLRVLGMSALGMLKGCRARCALSWTHFCEQLLCVSSMLCQAHSAVASSHTDCHPCHAPLLRRRCRRRCSPTRCSSGCGSTSRR